MAPSLQRWVVWSAWVVSIVAVVGAVVFLALGGGTVSWALVPGVPVLGFCCVGLVLRLRVPDNRIGWLFVGSGLVLGIGLLCDAYAYSAPVLGLSWRPVGAVAANLLFQVSLYLLPALLLVFPNGGLPSRRWRPLAVVWTVAAILVGLGVIVRPGGMVTLAQGTLDNPLAVSGRVGVIIRHAVGDGSFFVVVGGTFVAAGSLVLRYRRASGDLRQQLRWFGSAAALFAVACVFLGVLSHLGGTTLAWSVGKVVLPAAFTGVVAATGIAILRYRLYEIDLIIRKTLVYAMLVGSLALVYVGGLYVTDRALQALTGQSGALAVTLSTLAVAAAFQPLRAHIQRAVDHRFYRAKYDAAQTINAFTSRLRNQIELDALSTDVLDVVNLTLQPSLSSLWLRPTTPAPPDRTQPPP